VREALPKSDVKIEQRVIQGAPAAVLVEESQDADLLVVGSRGHGGFAQLLLGSVSQQCAQHSECPVVIVHAERR
jgi:nucleotide-binding universal stress UspA family protein